MIALDNIHKSFGDNHVLKGVSIAVPEGGVTALLGANGAGKTTLMKTLCGLLPVQGGSLRFLGEDKGTILFVNGGTAVEPKAHLTGTSVAFAGQAAYAQLLAGTDPANVPARAAIGSPRLVSGDTAVVVADVPTDVGLIRVTVTSTGGRWLIDDARPAPTP